jgi:hypothetical protein
MKFALDASSYLSRKIVSLKILAASIYSNLSISGLGLVNSAVFTLDLFAALSSNIAL